MSAPATVEGPLVGDRIRAFIEDLLPWFDRAAADAHDRRTERIRLRSIARRIRNEKVIAEYQVAAAASGVAVAKLIDEVRRPDDRR